jgi:hypothetical protein
MDVTHLVRDKVPSWPLMNTYFIFRKEPSGPIQGGEPKNSVRRVTVGLSRSDPCSYRDTLQVI